MKTTKLALPLLVALAYAPVQALAAPTSVLGGDLNTLAIFSYTTADVGANTNVNRQSIVYGSILGGGVTTTGAKSQVFGDISTPEAMTASAGAAVSGSIQSGGVLTTAANSGVGGSITSSGAASIGDTAYVGGNMVSGDVLSTGAYSNVRQSVYGSGAVSIGGNANVGGTVNGGAKITIAPDASIQNEYADATPIDPVSYKAALVSRVATDAKLVSDAQRTLHNMKDSAAASMGMNANGANITSALDATMTVNTTLDAGVYSAASLSTTAGIKLTLDGQGARDASWVFNITDILALGGTMTMAFLDAPGTPSVIWNVLNVDNAANGYATVGDGASILGTFLANTYILVGANSTVQSGTGTCNGLYSATSYVKTGDSAVVGSEGCKAAGSSPPPSPADVPEPGSLAMLLGGLGMLGFMVRRKQQA